MKPKSLKAQILLQTLPTLPTSIFLLFQKNSIHINCFFSTSNWDNLLLSNELGIPMLCRAGEESLLHKKVRSLLLQQATLMLRVPPVFPSHYIA
jgi:hypothetical protein